MSTEHQKYSTENQAEIIAWYAAIRGIDIVRTYADEGKSGLNIDGRDALKSLIDDVTKGRADFSIILAYDVSRWGRFQDADQSAYYEFVCRQAGVSVHYCAEQFEKDGTIGSNIIKTVKRAMAGEYSREAVRQSVHRPVQADHLWLPPRGGRPASACAGSSSMSMEIQRRNSRAVNTKACRPTGSFCAHHQVLTNEKYIGNNVYNRVSFKLKAKRVINPPDEWIRSYAGKWVMTV